MTHIHFSTAFMTQDKRMIVEAKSIRYWSVDGGDFDDGGFAVYGHFSKRDSLTMAVYQTEEAALKVLADFLAFVRNGDVCDWLWPDAGYMP